MGAGGLVEGQTKRVLETRPARRVKASQIVRCRLAISPCTLEPVETQADFLGDFGRRPIKRSSCTPWVISWTSSQDKVLELLELRSST